MPVTQLWKSQHQRLTMSTLIEEAHAIPSRSLGQRLHASELRK